MGTGVSPQGEVLAVALEWYEVSRAALVGVSRQVESMRMNCRNQRTASDDWGIHVAGALGECAFAKSTGRYWSGGVNTFKAGGDVGSIEVRTRSRHTYDLIVREGDKDASIFVLVTGGPREFLVHGWIDGRSAKKTVFLANHGQHGPAYFVPPAALNPMSTLERRYALATETL